MQLFGLFSPTVTLTEQLANHFGDQSESAGGLEQICDAAAGLAVCAGWVRNWKRTDGGLIAAPSSLLFWDVERRRYLDADECECESASGLVDSILSGHILPALDVPWIAADQARRTLWLFGSSAGGSTLFHTRKSDGTFVWATRPSLIRDARSLPLDRQGVGELVRFGANYGSRTILQGLQRIPFAHVLEVSPGRPEKLRPFQKFGSRPNSALTMPEAIRQTRQELEANLEICRGRSARLLFSGGVDSSLLAVLGKKTGALSHGTLLSMGPGDQNARVAKEFATASKLDVDIVQLRLDWSTVQEAVCSYALPTLDFAIIPTHQLGQEVMRRHGPRVLVDGTGGDAWFGFGSLRHADTWRQAFRWLRWFRGSARRLAPRMMLRPGRIQALFMAAARLPNRFDPALAYLCCNPGAMAELTLASGDWNEIESSLTVMLDELCLQSNLDDWGRIILSDATMIAMAQFAAKTSQWEMAVRATTIYPFCMPNLVDTGQSLPRSLLFEKGIAKPVLKALACESGMPQDFVYRRKSGFQPPLLTILTDPANQKVVLDLLERNDELDEFFSPRARDYCRRVLQAGRQVEIKALYFVWSLIGLKVWLDGFRSGRIDLNAKNGASVMSKAGT